ncbi:MAG: FtsX-like permease family protein [Thermoanaerobaculia bacterium]
MSFEAFVALRYLASSRKTAHVALISMISIAGLAVGVAALVISLALLSGFQDRIRAQMADGSPHVIVSPERGAALPDPERVRRALTQLPGVVSVEPVIEGRGWLSAAAGGVSVPVRYRNAPAGSLPSVPGREEAAARIAAPVGFRIGIGSGESVRLTSSRARLSPIGPLPVSIVLRVADLARRGALEKGAEVEVSEEVARALSGRSVGALAFEARLSDPAAADRAAREAAGRLGSGYRVETWRDRNAPLSFALRLEKLVIFATVALVILVAAFNIVSNVALLVVEKKRDLGVFTTMGAGPRSLSRVYRLLGAAIGAIGTAAGLALGIGASLLLDRFRLIPLPADVYLFTHVPFALHARDVLLVAAFAFGTALAAAALPARAAARIGPGEALGLSR